MNRMYDSIVIEERIPAHLQSIIAFLRAARQKNIVFPHSEHHLLTCLNLLRERLNAVENMVRRKLDGDESETESDTEDEDDGDLTRVEVIGGSSKAILNCVHGTVQLQPFAELRTPAEIQRTHTLDRAPPTVTPQSPRDVSATSAHVHTPPQHHPRPPPPHIPTAAARSPSCALRVRGARGWGGVVSSPARHPPPRCAPYTLFGIVHTRSVDARSTALEGRFGAEGDGDGLGPRAASGEDEGIASSYLRRTSHWLDTFDACKCASPARRDSKMVLLMVARTPPTHSLAKRGHRRRTADRPHLRPDMRGGVNSDVALPRPVGAAQVRAVCTGWARPADVRAALHRRARGARLCGPRRAWGVQPPQGAQLRATDPSCARFVGAGCLTGTKATA
ncbi:hypothetical protein B0H11DRAFT_1902391 [Mycena galericulata]|nr:hypothetical protein B0H11DRAFT_1902391 [Mycena galericulata]